MVDANIILKLTLILTPLMSRRSHTLKVKGFFMPKIMESNIIKSGNRTIIISGGDPLNDCPTDWDKAKEWQECANAKCDGDSPEWSWDCGFKLDFDGPLLRVSSRFYPPKTHYGSTWDGNVTIYIFDKEIRKTAFDCKTLDELKIAVESYIMGFVDEIEKHFNNV